MVTRRRTLLAAAPMVWAGALLARPARGQSPALQDRLRELFGDRVITPERVTLKLPALSENGSSVALEAQVDSPMTDADHVHRLSIVAEKNPLSEIAHFQFTPAAGRARAETRIRLADSQQVAAVAETSDGRLWLAVTEVVVTLAACINLS